MNKSNSVFLFILAILHLVGLIGFTHTALRPLILPLSALNLLISFIFLCFSFQNEFTKFFIFCLIVYTCGMSFEWIGVHSSYLFGSYSYGENLSLKLFGVPLIIGINWIILAVSSSVIAGKMSSNILLRTIIASGLMTFLDFLIEPVAVSSDFWSWEYGEIPLYNYICWFLLSLPLNFLYQKMRFNEQKPLAVGLYFIFVCFFAGLNLMTWFGGDQ